MLTHMEVDSQLPGAPALPMGGFAPNLYSIEIRDIQGLGPAKAAISSTPWALARGDYFQGSSTSPRNIVLTLGLNANWLTETPASLRRILYRYFMPESFATYRFYSDDLETVAIFGLVESFEPNIFSQDSEIQISIICDSPDFVADAETTVTGTTGSDPVEVDYAGSASTGFLLDIDGSGGYTGDVEVSNDIGPLHQDFVVNDVTLNGSHNFELNTLHGSRYVRRLSSDGDNDLLNQTSADSTWPEFSPGPNSLTVQGGSLAWSLTYHNRYGGL